jgi:hypothetical protein
MSIAIIYPAQKHSAYKIAAETFADLAKKVSSCEARLITDSEPLPDDCSRVVVIGADSVNRLAADLPASWRVEYDCSGRVFSGGFGAMLTREVWELDEDGELYDLLECETLDMAVWDGAEWATC